MNPFIARTGAPHQTQCNIAMTAAVLIMLTGGLSCLPAPVQGQGSSKANAAEQSPRWAPIHRVFGQGDAEDGYFRVNLPQSFEFTSYIGFVPIGSSNVMATSEVIVLQAEVPAVLTEARRGSPAGPTCDCAAQSSDE